MRHRGVSVKLLVATVMMVAIAIGAFSLFTEVQAAGGCICPLIYAPVLCDNGRTYTNGCFASCAHAHNCVPVGPGPIQL